MKKAFIKTLVLSMSILLGVATSVQAKVNSILVKESSTSKYYEYSFNELISESQGSVIGINAPLLDEYKSRNIVAYHDSDKGYVKFNVVIDAAQSATINNKDFDINSFIASLQDQSAIFSPSTDVQKRKTQDGKVVNEELNPSEDYFDFDTIE